MTASGDSELDLHWVQRPGRPVGKVLRPHAIIDALTALSATPNAQPVAGGTDLLLELARGESGPAVSLVDLTGIEDFATIRMDADAGEIVLGGGATHNDIVAHQDIVDHALPLAQACLEIGSPQLRNRATVAGNLVTASPANDTLSALVALGASIELSSLADGAIQMRSVDIDDFFVGFRETVVQPDELLTAVRVPTLAPSQAGIWAKLGLRKAQAISVVHGAVVVERDDTGVVRSARIAIGSVGPTVAAFPDISAQLIGKPLTPESIAAAAQTGAAAITPISDLRADEAYRREGTAVLLKRMLTAIADNRHAERWPQRVLRLSNRSVPPLEGRRSMLAPPQTDIDDSTEIAVTINDRSITAGGAASVTLLDWIRTNAGWGTKEGCAEGECGACTVHLDGDAVMSCLVPAAQADRSMVTTVEGLADGPVLSTMQQQFVEAFAVQCGYCIPGFVTAAAALAAEVDLPTEDEIEFGLSGNLCRCTGYYTIVEAVQAAAAGMNTASI